MTRRDAIDIIMNTIDLNDVVVSTTGLISREIFERFDSDRNIYVPGSMGLCSSIGLGLAVSLKEKRIIIIDGDASLLMNLASIVTIGNYKPSNLFHFVLDNGAYGSCSEEKSMSDSANFDKLTKDVGYSYVKVVNSRTDLKRAIIMLDDNGPGFILVKIKLGGRRDFKRPLELPQIKNRFMLFLNKSLKGEKYDVPREKYI